MGAHNIGRLLAKHLQEAGEEVICIDSNPQRCSLAENEGIKIINGNGLEEKILLRAEIDTRKGSIALTDNEEVNYLFTKNVKDIGKISNLLIGIKQDKTGITEEMIEEIGARIPFSFPRDLEQWNIWISHNKTKVLQYTYNLTDKIPKEDKYFGDDTKRLLLPLTCNQNDTIIPIDNKTEISNGCMVLFLINSNRIDEVNEWFGNNNWISTK